MPTKKNDEGLIKRNMHENDGRPAKPADLGKFASVSDAIVDQYEEPDFNAGAVAEFGNLPGEDGEHEKVRTAVKESLVDNAERDATEQSFEQNDQEGVEVKVTNPERDIDEPTPTKKATKRSKGA